MTEAESLIVAYAKTQRFGMLDPAEIALIDYGRQLIAKHQPRLMDTSDLLTKYREQRISYNDAASIDRVRTIFLANIITVLGTAFVNASEEFADKRDVNRAAAIVARILGKAS